MPVVLESRTRRMQVFHLAHDVCCRDGCSCAEVTVVATLENPRTGERASQPVRKKVASSLTILARERTTGLPAAVLKLAEVKAALACGYLRVVEQTHEPTPAARQEIATTALTSRAAQGLPPRADAADKEP